MGPQGLERALSDLKRILSDLGKALSDLEMALPCIGRVLSDLERALSDLEGPFSLERAISDLEDPLKPKERHVGPREGPLGPRKGPPRKEGPLGPPAQPELWRRGWRKAWKGPMPHGGKLSLPKMKTNRFSPTVLGGPSQVLNGHRWAWDGTLRPGMGSVKPGLGPLRSGMNPSSHEMGPSSMKWALSIMKFIFESWHGLSKPTQILFFIECCSKVAMIICRLIKFQFWDQQNQIKLQFCDRKWLPEFHPIPCPIPPFYPPQILHRTPTRPAKQRAPAAFPAPDISWVRLPRVFLMYEPFISRPWTRGTSIHIVTRTWCK